MRLPWIIVFALGCSETFSSEQGQLEFKDEAVLDDADDNGFANYGPVLVGTQLCPSVDCSDCEELAVEDAFVSDVSGPASQDADGCLSFDGVGAVTWSWEPTAAGTDQGLVADTVEFEVVDGDDVQVELYYYFEDAVTDMVEDGTFVISSDSQPEDWLPGEGEPLRLFADTPITLDLLLRAVSDGRLVGWWFPAASVEAQGDVQASLADSPSSDLTLQAPAGASGAVTVTVGEGSWELGDVMAVSEDEAASLEVVAFSWADGQDGLVGPIAARAIVRDADDNPIFGVPVSWHLARGFIDIEPVDRGLGDDYVILADECRLPSKRDGVRKARLVASYKGLKDSVLFEWDEAPFAAIYTDEELAQMDEDWERPENCQRGCGCAHVNPVGSGLFGLLLGMGALARRRHGA